MTDVEVAVYILLPCIGALVVLGVFALGYWIGRNIIGKRGV